MHTLTQFISIMMGDCHSLIKPRVPVSQSGSLRRPREDEVRNCRQPKIGLQRLPIPNGPWIRLPLLSKLAGREELLESHEVGRDSYKLSVSNGIGVAQAYDGIETSQNRLTSCYLESCETGGPTQFAVQVSPYDRGGFKVPEDVRAH